MNINRLKITLGIAFIVIMGIIYFTYSTVQRADKAAIDIEVFPKDTALTINGNSVGRGTTYLDPGSYSLVASRGGFKEYSETIQIEKSTTSLAIMLEAESDEAKEYVEKHQNDYKRAREQSYRAAEEKGKLFYDKNPIARELPVKTSIYSIGYISDKSDPSGNSIIVTIQASEAHRQSALYKIRQLGYDPTDLNILFRDYENPFPL